MSEGKRTPGPYWNCMRTIYRGRLDTISSSHEVAEVVPEADLEEVNGYVDLLNKGTHFDRMLEALKAQRDAEGILTRSDRDQALARAWAMVDAAIAEAEGGEDA